MAKGSAYGICHKVDELIIAENLTLYQYYPEIINGTVELNKQEFIKRELQDPVLITWHKHDIHYMHVDNTITASCTNYDGGKCVVAGEKQAVITPPNDLIYSGYPAYVNINGSPSYHKSYNRVAFPDLQIHYFSGNEELSEAPIDAGSYTAKVTVGDCEVQVPFTISKATPCIQTAPTAAAITYGQTLADSTLSGGEGSVPGSFA